MKNCPSLAKLALYKGEKQLSVGQKRWIAGHVKKCLVCMKRLTRVEAGFKQLFREILKGTVIDNLQKSQPKPGDN
ncbi:MAG: hypothetical protein A3C06_00200 [Candidatus Taylorbacteria bacterium RIFCSPHIGHO2_02_FULL_46_13]|uniref:Zinc-finger domain-containing protein n=1 Tax=Candidatus Taylorbacteria bacterium RIFCSPHIGHO2_02_FULL_46_13 TaxID=1802312 RepID=A0A1G2MS86_9BACT|nr:MAG: hypothetical protein A3C06_00200 [Candidatus Taylorbacteria bacterium RIFCSPHIGHO2_02_FULL_46_13]